MKYLEVTQLQSKSETPTKILEDNLGLTNKNILMLKSDISLFIDDLQKLREGLFYKHEEIQKEIYNKTPTRIINDFEEFEENFSKISMYEVVQIKNILNEHYEIHNMKNDLRIISILYELKKKNYSAIVKLISNKDEWQFLSLFFSKVLENIENSEDLYSAIKKYKHKMEETIFASFQSMIQTKDYEGVKNCYLALKQINKHKLLINAYIESLSLYDMYKKDKPKFDTIELDLFMNENNSFIRYLNEIEKLYMKTLNEIKKMFDKPEKIIEKMDKCIFEEVLPQHLEFCIEQNEPVLFMLNFEFFAKNTKVLLQNIHTANENLNTKEVYDKLYTIYMTEVLYKEKDFFDYLFDVIAKKKNTKYKYFFKSTEIATQDFKPFNEATNIVKVATLIVKRSKTLEYSNETLESIFKHVFRKMNQFVDIVCNSFQGIDRFELIKILSDIYLLVRNYLSTHANFVDFQEYVNEIIQANIQTKIKETEMHIKHVVKTLNFRDNTGDNTKMIIQLLAFLERELRIVELNIKGKNGTKYFINLLTFLHHRLYKQYFTILYSKSDSFYALNDLRVVLKFVKKNQFIEVYGLFEYLMEVMEFITVQKNDILLYYKAMTNKMPENELKAILKCRNDYKDVKKLFY
ncbi:hypothetical protein BDAP_000175 [Binucleata daphniae]